MCSLEKAWLVLSLMWCLIEFERLEKCLGIYNSNDCKCLAEQTIKIYLPCPSKKCCQECKRKLSRQCPDKSHSLWIPKWKEIELRKLIGKKDLFAVGHTRCQICQCLSSIQMKEDDVKKSSVFPTTRVSGVLPWVNLRDRPLLGNEVFVLIPDQTHVRHWKQRHKAFPPSHSC